MRTFKKVIRTNSLGLRYFQWFDEHYECLPDEYCEEVQITEEQLEELKREFRDKAI